jgi:DNA-binding beta-propeller fold protein YncE
MLFTDIVRSTEHATRLGDARWGDLLQRHHALVRRELKRHGGHEVDTTGDGFFATFAEPAEAIRCAVEVRDGVRRLELEIRAGLHFGEVEPGEKVGGVAVVIAARILAAAQPGEVLVSRTLKELVTGADLRFADRGPHALKGVPGEWHLFALEPLPTAELVPPSVGVTLDAGPRRWSRPLAAMAAAVVLGLGALGVYAIAVDRTPSFTGPNSVVRIDSGSNEIVDGVRVGEGPAALTVGEGALWVANVTDATVSRIDLESRTETARPGGLGVPAAIVAAEGSIWVADGFSGRLSTIDPGTARVTLVSAEHHGMTAIASGFDAVWIVDAIAEAILRVDPRTELIVDTIELPPGTGPIAIATGADAIWVANQLSMTLVRIDPAVNQVVGAPIVLCCPPSGLVVTATEAWVSSAAGDRLQRVDIARGAVALTIEVGNGPSALASDGEAVWVAHEADSTVWRLDPTGKVVEKVALDGSPSALALVNGSLWVALRTPQ